MKTVGDFILLPNNTIYNSGFFFNFITEVALEE